MIALTVAHAQQIGLRSDPIVTREMASEMVVLRSRGARHSRRSESNAGHPASPLVRALEEHGSQLLDASESAGATMALCGSVARGEDKEGSDLDFYALEFRDPDAPDGRSRGERLVQEFRRILAPIAVDVRGVPGWWTDGVYEESMKRDATDLRELLDDLKGRRREVTR